MCAVFCFMISLHQTMSISNAILDEDRCYLLIWGMQGTSGCPPSSHVKIFSSTSWKWFIGRMPWRFLSCYRFVSLFGRGRVGSNIFGVFRFPKKKTIHFVIVKNKKSLKEPRVDFSKSLLPFWECENRQKRTRSYLRLMRIKLVWASCKTRRHQFEKEPIKFVPSVAGNHRR